MAAVMTSRLTIDFNERPYSGKTFRPRPEIHLDTQARSLIVATPWGPREAARKVIDRMNDYLSLAREDGEATSPFERLTCLSKQANHLRIAAMLANDALYREDNQAEYRAGVELFALQIEGNEVAWIQAGHPQILLGRQGRALSPMGSQIDMSFDLSGSGSFLAPLPSQLLGLDNSINLNVNGFRAQAGDRLVLLSHSSLPETLFKLGGDEVSIETLSRALARSHPELAFWLGILTIRSDEMNQDQMDQNQPGSDPDQRETF